MFFLSTVKCKRLADRDTVAYCNVMSHQYRFHVLIPYARVVCGEISPSDQIKADIYISLSCISNVYILLSSAKTSSSVTLSTLVICQLPKIYIPTQSSK